MQAYFVLCTPPANFGAALGPMLLISRCEGPLLRLRRLLFSLVYSLGTEDISFLAQLVERVTSNDEVSRSSRLMGTHCATLCFCLNHVRSNKIHALEHATCVFIY